MNELLAAVPALWQREAAAVFFGFLCGIGFLIFGALSFGILAVVFRDKMWWKNILMFLILLPFGAGVVPGIALFCLWVAGGMAEQQPILSDWVWTGFFSFPVGCAALMAWGKKGGIIKKGWQMVVSGVADGVSGVAHLMLVTFGWLLLIGSTAGVVLCPLSGYWGWFVMSLLVSGTGWWILYEEQKR